MNRRQFLLASTALSASVAGCSAETGGGGSSNNDPDPTPSETETTSQQQNTIPEVQTDWSGIPSTTLLGYIYRNGPTFENVSNKDYYLVQSLHKWRDSQYPYFEGAPEYGELRSELEGRYYFGGGVTSGIGNRSYSGSFVSVYKTAESASAEYSVQKQRFEGEPRNIGGTEWYVFAPDIEFSDGAEEAPGPLIAMSRINNCICYLSVIRHEFEDPESVLIESIESKENEYAQAGIDATVAQIMAGYNRADRRNISPDVSTARERDTFGIPFEEVSKEQVDQSIRDNIGEFISPGLKKIQPTNGPRDAVNEYEINGKIDTDEYDMVFGTIDTYRSNIYAPDGRPPARGSGSENQIVYPPAYVSLKYAVTDTVERAVEMYTSEVQSRMSDYYSGILGTKPENLGAADLLESSIEEYGYQSTFVNGVYTDEYGLRDTVGGYTYRQLILSGNAILRLEFNAGNSP
jgi:hypothetical protein